MGKALNLQLAILPRADRKNLLYLLTEIHWKDMLNFFLKFEALWRLANMYEMDGNAKNSP